MKLKLSAIMLGLCVLSLAAAATFQPFSQDLSYLETADASTSSPLIVSLPEPGAVIAFSCGLVGLFRKRN